MDHKRSDIFPEIILSQNVPTHEQVQPSSRPLQQTEPVPSSNIALSQNIGSYQNQSFGSKSIEDPFNSLSILLSLQISVQIFKNEAHNLEKKEKQLAYMISQAHENVEKTKKKVKVQSKNLKDELCCYWKLKQMYIKDKMIKQQEWLKKHRNPFEILQEHLESHLIPHIFSQFQQNTFHQSNMELPLPNHLNSIRFIHSRMSRPQSPSSSQYQYSQIIDKTQTILNDIFHTKNHEKTHNQLSFSKQLSKIKHCRHKKIENIRKVPQQKDKKHHRNLKMVGDKSEDTKTKKMTNKIQSDSKGRKKFDIINRRKHLSLGNISIPEVCQKQRSLSLAPLDRKHSIQGQCRMQKKKIPSTKESEFSLPSINTKKR